MSKPIVFLDIESTGLNISTDKIIEIALIKRLTDGSIIKKRKLINPGITITKESSNIHGITNEMVAEAPTFKQVANEIKQFIDCCDLCGFNSNHFDVPLLIEEFLRVDMLIATQNILLVDVQKIFHTMEPRNLAAAYKFYCNKELIHAHSAEVDAMATMEILDEQLKKYGSILGTDVETVVKKMQDSSEEFVDFSKRLKKKNGVVIFNFGKHKDKPVEQVFKDEPQYYDWIMQHDFSLHTKMKITELFNKFKLQKK